MDRFIAEGFELLGEKPPDDVFLRYEWTGESAESTPIYSQGATRKLDSGVRIRSDHLIHEHELAHAVHLRAWPHSASFLYEGFAVLIDPRRVTVPIGWQSQVDLDSILEASSLSAQDYYSAWYLVSQIVADHGIAGLRELWHAVPRGASAQEVRDAYASLFDRPIDVLLEPWIYQSDDPELDGSEVERYACTFTLCTGEIPSWHDGVWSASGPRDCEDDPRAIGPFQRGGTEDGPPVWTEFVFDPQDMPFERDPMNTATTVQIRYCNLDCIQSTAYDWGQGPAPDEPWRTSKRRRIEIHVEPETLPTDEPDVFRYLRPDG